MINNKSRALRLEIDEYRTQTTLKKVISYHISNGNIVLKDSASYFA